MYFGYIFKDLLIYFRERESARKQASMRWGGAESLKQTPLWVWSPMRGSIPRRWDNDLSQNQESDT